MTSLLACDNGLFLGSEQDALDALSSGLPGCIFTPNELSTDFFELNNGIAGSVFQKFVNYRFPVVIVIPTDHAYGERVSELVRDHQTHPYIRFHHSIEDAVAWMSSAI